MIVESSKYFIANFSWIDKSKATIQENLKTRKQESNKFFKLNHMCDSM